MKKLLKDEIQKVKLEIKNRYKAGESVPSIAKTFEVVPRTIYFHLGVLTPEEKGEHAKNYSLRKHAQKAVAQEESHVGNPEPNPTPEPVTESIPQGETPLADFIQG